MRIILAIRYAVGKRIAMGRAKKCRQVIASVLLETAMFTKDEIRRRRLEELCQREGGPQAVADKAKLAGANLSGPTLDQIIKGSLLPAKADGSRSPRALGDALARKIEEVFDLGEGWLDWPFSNVDFKRFIALNPYQRAYFEGQMITFLDQAEKFKGVPAEANGAPVPNKKVEKHYKAPPKAPVPETKNGRTEEAPQAKKKATSRHQD
jgi:hypothetical protein